jgi:hypothetical protein
MELRATTPRPGGRAGLADLATVTLTVTSLVAFLGGDN